MLHILFESDLIPPLSPDYRHLGAAGEGSVHSNAHSNHTLTLHIYTDDPLAYIRRYIDDILE